MPLDPVHRRWRDAEVVRQRLVAHRPRDPRAQRILVARPQQPAQIGHWRVRLTFFGRLRETVGAGEIDRSPPANVVDCESLRAWISTEFPALLDPKVRIAIDDVIALGSAPIAGAREVAFLPPVSGG